MEKPAQTSKSAGALNQHPIAIVGISCRLPGGIRDGESYWQVLRDARDAVTDLADGRWNPGRFYDPEPGVRGKTCQKWGGFVNDIAHFDPQFFGISPREAAQMDPQHRLLLELAWEAFEDGGHPLQRLSGSRTAVFVGIASMDYAMLQAARPNPYTIDTYTNIGGALSMAANRISHAFDLRGPSVALDTACSSALMAVHLACQAIWQGGCPMALAGGVNALIIPDWYVGFSRMMMLSPTGRCKAFAAEADGFVRSEGGGVVLLKPLAQALADRDRIYATIRATATNQDGRTPVITAPSRESQVELIRDACRAAGVSPSQIDYVEAHGTGTQIGDPIETDSLGTVLGGERPDEQPCLIGSSKTNIGHLEAGAGIAGLIKVALALHHRQVPPNLHFCTPNPQIDFQRLRLRVPLQLEDWPQGNGPDLAAVNSFGFGGTNAHAILEGPPRSDPPQQRAITASDHAELVPISARNPEALRDAARSLGAFLEAHGDSVSFADVCHTAAIRRTHHPHRATFVASNNRELRECLVQHAAQEPATTSVNTPRLDAQSRLAFVCAGQGPQWWAMGRELLADEPRFQTVIEECDRILRHLGDWSLLDELRADETNSRMDITAISQPTIFSLQIALASLWQSWGIEPDALVGHSVGEVAAAYLAGALSLEDAMCVIYHRGRCMELAPSRGRMVAAALTADEAQTLIAPFAGKLELAAINGPDSVTLSGEAEAVDEVHALFKQRNVYSRMLQVNYAFHTAQMDSIRDELLQSLASIEPHRAELPLFSTVIGDRVEGFELGPEYWWQNVRQTVRFAQGVEGLIALGCQAVVELSPHPVLASVVAECYRSRRQPVRVLPSLRRMEPERATMLKSLGALYEIGADVDWDVVAPSKGELARLPTYPWQHKLYWSETSEQNERRLGDPGHPLLGRRLDTATSVWQGRLELRELPYLRDHCVQGAFVVPATAYLEMAFTMGAQLFGDDEFVFEDVQLTKACFLDEDAGCHLQTAHSATDDRFSIHARTGENISDWVPLVSASVRRGASAEQQRPIEDIRDRCRETISRETCYEAYRISGLEFGPTFQGVQEIWRGEKEALGWIEPPAAVVEAFDSYRMHPAALDACFHVIGAIDDAFGDPENTPLLLPVKIERVRLLQVPTTPLWSHARLVSRSAKGLVADVDVMDDEGHLIAEVRGLHCQRMAGTRSESSPDEMIYESRWQMEALPLTLESTTKDQVFSENGRSANESRTATSAESVQRPTQAEETTTEPGRWLLFADESGVGAKLASLFRARGQECVIIRAKSATRAGNGNEGFIDPTSRDELLKLVQEFVSADDLPIRGVVHLWNLDAPAAETVSVRQLADWQDRSLMSVLHLTQSWIEVGAAASPFCLVTRGLQPVEEPLSESSVVQSPLVGLGRVIANEYPKFRCKLIDLASAASDGEVAMLLDELDAGDNEDEIALRGSGRFVHRYAHWQPIVQSTTSGQLRRFRLAASPHGIMDELAFRELPERSLGPNEVEVQVLASGLNFADVLKALGLYPGLPDGPVPLGFECSGVISAVGSEVQNVRVGDEIVAVAPFSQGSHTVVHAEFCTPKPAGLTFEEAAAIPIAFLTARYALEYLGRMQPGERVLIHSATGGVGMAAIQLARRAGAEVFATAGTPEKREYLRKLGVKQVMDSRSLDFADEIRKSTYGKGVDIVLNSLAGEAINKGLEALSDYGRFLEIGKRDIYANSRIGLKPFRNNVSFLAIDLDRVMRERPAILVQILRDCVRDFEQGELTPLPLTEFAADDVIDAFRYMRSGRHIGKVVVSMRQPPSAIVPNLTRPITLDSDATYLVAGGLGGFGLELARWMVDRGARHLTLVGRRGANSEAARRTVAELRDRGIDIKVVAGDVSRPNVVAEIVTQIGCESPLKGVFHAAMVLDDQLLVNLSRDSFVRMLEPKMHGAWNLHEATRGHDLDHFVLFSTLSSILGTPGQGNYAAANTFLDSLAHYRRSIGLPALAINWGPIADVGYIARHQSLSKRLDAQGVRSMPARQNLELMERAMRGDVAQVGILDVDWSRWSKSTASVRLVPRFRDLCLSFVDDGQSTSGGATSTRRAILAADPDNRHEVLLERLRERVARVLGTSSDQLDVNRSVIDLGVDSLMAVDLMNWVESDLQVQLPIVELMRSPSLVGLTETLLPHLTEPAEADEIETPADIDDEGADTIDAAVNQKAREARQALDRLDDISSDEIDLLLAAMLDEDRAGLES